jgi:glycosyltransferase involved in cell wall biosynthesis
LRLLYRTCSKLLYVGEHSLRHFSRLGVPRSKLAFSPYCVDTKPFRISDRDRAELRNTMRARLNLAPDDVMLLFSGKLSYRKGPDLLLKAAKALPQQTRRRIVAGFLGSGDMQPELAALAQRQPSIPVHFFGFQNQTQLSAYYHAADLLVLPSRHSETWGLVVNEALHHGLPAIVSEAVGCAPDLIVPGRTGELFETNSVQSLTEAILRGLPLAIDPCVRSNCREKIAAYTVEKAAEGIASAFWSVVQPDHIEDPCPVLN